MNSRRKLLLLASLILSLLLGKRYLRDQEELLLSDWFHPRNRPDVVTTADWLAPVVWEGTFDRKVLERYYRRQNLTVGLAVFAIGRAADQYLEPFLKSANKHFMTGHRVIIYIVVHRGYQVPPLQPDPLRTFKVVSVGQESWWPDLDLDLNLDLDLVRMKKLGELIVSHIRWEADFLFIMRVEQAFQGDVGLEILGTAVAQLHAWWYFQDEKNLPYERRPESAACIPYGEGDFFYDGAFVGGTPLQILSLVEAYLRGVFHDMKLGLKSTYERHLNKYFFLHKPTKLLSPEYGWDVVFPPPRQVRYVKVLQLAKRGP